MPALKKSTDREKAVILAKLAGKAYLSSEELKASERDLGLQRKKSKYINVDDTAEAWVFYTRDNSVVVACRGTEPTELKDVVADLDLYPLQHPRAGRVHRGFYAYAQKVYPLILEEIQKNATEKSEVYVCGHSLGGAMAVLVAENLVSDGIAVKELRTFGQPRVGTKGFIEHLGTCGIGEYKRYVNNNDVVPKVPPTFLFFKHGGSLEYINYYGYIRECTMWQRTKDQFRGVFKAMSKFQFFDFVMDHGMPYYIDYLDKINKIDK